MEEVEFITVDDLAKQLGVHRVTILRRIKQGVYPPFVGDQKKSRNPSWTKVYWDEWWAIQANK